MSLEAKKTGEGHLKAGVNVVRKPLLHIDIVDLESSLEAVMEHVKRLNVMVISCYEAKSWMRADERELVKAYRLCVESKDKAKVCLPADVCPAGIMIGDWLFRNTRNGGSS